MQRKGANTPTTKGSKIFQKQGSSPSRPIRMNNDATSTQVLAVNNRKRKLETTKMASQENDAPNGLAIEWEQNPSKKQRTTKTSSSPSMQEASVATVKVENQETPSQDLAMATQSSTMPMATNVAETHIVSSPTFACTQAVSDFPAEKNPFADMKIVLHCKENNSSKHVNCSRLQLMLANAHFYHSYINPKATFTGTIYEARIDLESTYKFDVVALLLGYLLYNSVDIVALDKKKPDLVVGLFLLAVQCKLERLSSFLYEYLLNKLEYDCKRNAKVLEAITIYSALPTSVTDCQIVREKYEAYILSEIHMCDSIVLNSIMTRDLWRKVLTSENANMEEYVMLERLLTWARFQVKKEVATDVSHQRDFRSCIQDLLPLIRFEHIQPEHLHFFAQQTNMFNESEEVALARSFLQAKLQQPYTILGTEYGSHVENAPQARPKRKAARVGPTVVNLAYTIPMSQLVRHRQYVLSSFEAFKSTWFLVLLLDSTLNISVTLYNKDMAEFGCTVVVDLPSLVCCVQLATEEQQSLATQTGIVRPSEATLGACCSWPMCTLPETTSKPLQLFVTLEHQQSLFSSEQARSLFRPFHKKQ